MDTPKTTPKDFFLWAGAMVAFYWSVIAYIFLVFEYITYTFPNPLAYYPIDPYQSGISYQMASIIVLLPVYLVLMRLIRKDIAADPSKSNIWVRRWALILTLFVAGASVVVDLIVLLTTFLNGEELTTAFLLKTLVVLLVAGGVFLHFISDLRGYWERFPDRKRMVIIGVSVLAVATIVAGFFIVGTPGEARRARFDAERVSHLQSLQSQIIYYWQAKQVLPADLSEFKDSFAFGDMPVSDPETGEPYVYERTGPLSFKLCAEFRTESRAQSVPSKALPYMGEYRGNMDEWKHGTGEVCFDRTIDPSFYPPINK